MGLSRRRIQCDEHGPSPPCMICRHLREGRGLGYVRLTDDSGSIEVTGLCEACAQLLLDEDGWTDRLFAFADWQLYCEQCFRRELRRRRHRLVGRGRLACEEDQ
jgi:hypothetical protein